ADMKYNKQMLFAVVALIFAMSTCIAAQSQTDPQKQRPRTTSSPEPEKKEQRPLVITDSLEPDDKSRTPPHDCDYIQANRQQEISEDAAINPYYNNFFSTYRLCPEDVISVDVFNQDRSSRKNIIIPPSGRIALSLIPGGVFVNGKTVDEVADII